MKCLEAKRIMSSYLDCQITRDQMSTLQTHLESCTQCLHRFRALERTKLVLSSLGRKPVPAELALQLRVAVSQQIAAVRRSRFEMLRVHWDNAFRALMVPATGGLVTAVLTFGLLINLLMPIPVQDPNDVPTTFYTPPQLQTTPFELAVDTARSEPLIVEALVGADGRVQDYRILSGGDNVGSSIANLKNMLIFATFRPATSFGRPTAGRTILSFSKIQVKG